ncbi:probable DNA replication complex GINS protein PSF2 [Danaus plexippus]|uniref:DNA replication complex GINS protein PSF2 n=1 Tax=Danaus plexippus plexippus TaxID=278856 RepID=A0A212EVH9_DANPL|nr:probable DNA replication complex GINS protein PSF2 [Danaus plexippus]OWR45505.1 putative DNA replication complex GINS protein PSF2 [Danaus plexippus plexippus]
MDPYEIEFIGENRIVSIIPNFSYDKIYLICGEFGPFRAGLPMNVPLWLAVMLKQKQKCRIVPPDWMDIEILEGIKEEEKKSRFFTKMPNEHYMVEAKLILGAANEDIPRAAEIKTIIKDIWDIRMSKLRTSMDALMKSGGSYGRLDHLTMMEINSVKPILPEAMDELYRIKVTSRKTIPATLNSSTYSQSGTSQNT